MASIQAVPGYHNYSWFKIEKPGVYRGQCANLCGRGHARMIAIVHAEEPAQFDIWLANQKRMLEEAEATRPRNGPRSTPTPDLNRSRTRERSGTRPPGQARVGRAFRPPSHQPHIHQLPHSHRLHH